MDADDGEQGEVDSEFERLVLKDLRNKGYKVTTQWKVGSYRIDLVIEGLRDRLAVECDGDRFHTVENLQEDMDRQVVLERLGWRFIRVRGSEFFRRPDRALIPLYERLERMGIEPQGGASTPTDTDLSKRVIAEARKLRAEWESEPEVIDEILGRTHPKYTSELQAEDNAEEEIAAPLE